MNDTKNKGNQEQQKTRQKRHETKRPKDDVNQAREQPGFAAVPRQLHSALFNYFPHCDAL